MIENKQTLKRRLFYYLLDLDNSPPSPSIIPSLHVQIILIKAMDIHYTKDKEGEREREILVG